MGAGCNADGESGAASGVGGIHADGESGAASGRAGISGGRSVPLSGS